MKKYAHAKQYNQGRQSVTRSAHDCRISEQIEYQYCAKKERLRSGYMLNKMCNDVTPYFHMHPRACENIIEKQLLHRYTVTRTYRYTCIRCLLHRPHILSPIVIPDNRQTIGCKDTTRFAILQRLQSMKFSETH